MHYNSIVLQITLTLTLYRARLYRNLTTDLTPFSLSLSLSLMEKQSKTYRDTEKERKREIKAVTMNQIDRHRQTARQRWQTKGFMKPVNLPVSFPMLTHSLIISSSLFLFLSMEISIGLDFLSICCLYLLLLLRLSLSNSLSSLLCYWNFLSLQSWFSNLSLSLSIYLSSNLIFFNHFSLCLSFSLYWEQKYNQEKIQISLSVSLSLYQLLTFATSLSLCLSQSIHLSSNSLNRLLWIERKKKRRNKQRYTEKRGRK